MSALSATFHGFSSTSKTVKVTFADTARSLARWLSAPQLSLPVRRQPEGTNYPSADDRGAEWCDFIYRQKVMKKHWQLITERGWNEAGVIDKTLEDGEKGRRKLLLCLRTIRCRHSNILSTWRGSEKSWYHPGKVQILTGESLNGSCIFKTFSAWTKNIFYKILHLESHLSVFIQTNPQKG